MRALLALLASLLVLSCDDKPAEPPEVTKEEPKVEDKAPEAPVLPREVHGVPLPPQLVEVQENTRNARAATTLDLKEVANFYESRLVDYEFLEFENRMELRPLRDYMPLIRLSQPRRKMNTAIFIIIKDDQTLKKFAAEFKGEYVKGEPVDFKTPDGELMAPGARWGESYTPPPGSPLDKPRYKSNFGKPFGEWVSQ